MLWESISSKEFEQSFERTKGVCLIPIGVIEKHGQHLPLGTDMYIGRYIGERAGEKADVMVLPYYFFGQIVEARHVPGTLALSPEMMWRVLKEICSEVSRNGYKKIVLYSSHGGNTHFLRYFVQMGIAEKKDYALYLADPDLDVEGSQVIIDLIGSDDMGGHAGNSETSRMMAIRPDLVHMDRVEKEGLIDHDDLKELVNIQTPVDWYAAHPTHMAGEPFHANLAAGQKQLEMVIDNLADLLLRIKADAVTPVRQQEFMEKAYGRED